MRESFEHPYCFDCDFFGDPEEFCDLPCTCDIAEVVVSYDMRLFERDRGVLFGVFHNGASAFVSDDTSLRGRDGIEDKVSFLLKTCDVLFCILIPLDS